jgi:hypothetical protein
MKLANLLCLFTLTACTGSPVRAPASAPLLDPAWINRLPVWESNHAELLGNDPAMVALSRGLGGPLSDFYNYRNLLPHHFRIASGAGVAPFVDGLLLKIMSTNQGKRSFCFLAGAGDGVISYYLGASAPAAARIRAACAGTPASAQSRMAAGAMAMYPQLGKKYVLVIAEGEIPRIEGFTTAARTTLFVLDRDDLSETNLLRTMAHELAMTFDQLALLADTSIAETWETGLATALGKDRFDPSGHATTIFETPANLAQVRCAIRDPALRYAAATERAFRFEDEIIAELGMGGLSPALAANAGCRPSLEKWLPVFPDIFAVVREQILDEEGFYERTCGETEPQLRSTGNALRDEEARLEAVVDRFKNPADPVRAHWLGVRLATLAATSLRYKSNGQTIPLCDFLLSPHVGARDFNVVNDGGPRPRAGGW